MKPENHKIPFNKPSFTGKELHYITDAIWNGQISGGGVYTKKCQAFLKNLLHVPEVLLATSCTHALEMAGLLLDLKPGDEVILPSFTFVSTANAFALRGARPVFCDIRPDTLNLDENKIESLITPKTRAIVPVHYAGVGCEMEAMLAIAKKHRLAVIEDNAHGLFAQYKGKFLGSFGDLATQSFHETKNFTCGEGGALLINKKEWIEAAEIIREKGTNRTQYYLGQVDKYTWVSLGSSYIPSEILAAFLFAQLEGWQAIQKKRRQIWEKYQKGLSGWAEKNNVVLPFVPTYCEQSYHMFYLMMPTLEARQKFIQQLKEKGVLAVFHYVPLHSSEMGKRFGHRAGDCPVSEDRSQRLVRLPFFNSLSEKEQSFIIDTIVHLTL